VTISHKSNAAALKAAQLVKELADEQRDDPRTGEEVSQKRFVVECTRKDLVYLEMTVLASSEDEAVQKAEDFDYIDIEEIDTEEGSLEIEGVEEAVA